MKLENIKERKNVKALLFVIAGLCIMISCFFFLRETYSLPDVNQAIHMVSNGYSNKDAGSYEVIKSAEWYDLGKAKITFDVHTVSQEVNEKEVIVLVDTSISNQENMPYIKEILEQLLNEGKTHIVAFSSDATILTNENSTKEEILKSLDEIKGDDNTNYYAALNKGKEILKNLSNPNVLLLFFTGSTSTIATENEEILFKTLKQNYPKLLIKSIQIGLDFENPILKNYSDNFYHVKKEEMQSLSKELFIYSNKYEQFLITDYVNQEIFEIEKVETSKGNSERIENKILWDLQGLVSGSIEQMNIYIKVKENKNNEEKYITNTMEMVESTIEGKTEKIESTESPILASKYEVIYDVNAPNNCEVANIPANEFYKVGETVKISQIKPECEGYIFKGWKIVTEEIEKYNDDYFKMPGKTVVLKALWSNLSLTKNMDGTIKETPSNMLQEITESDIEIGGTATMYYRNSVYGSYLISNLIFESEISPHEDAVKVVDFSAIKDGSVLGYYVLDPSTSNSYNLYIQADGKIKANKKSAYMFFVHSFDEKYNVQGIENIDFSQVEDASDTFFYYPGSTLDLSNFDTSNVTDMSHMFSNASSLTKLNLSSFDTSNVTDMSYMFSGASSLTELDLSNFNTSNVTNMRSMFSNASSLTELDLSNFDTSNVTNMINMFSGASSLTELDLSNFNTSNVTNMNNMFSDASSLTKLDLSNFNTSNVTDMSAMFSDTSLTKLDLSNFDTSNVTGMSSMFYGMTSLTSLDLSHFDTSNVTNMGSMFSDASSLTKLDLSHFDTSNVTNMSYMFSGASSLTELDLSNFNTSNVTNMRAMFYGMTSLTSLDLSHFDTSNVTNLDSMFSNASSLTELDLSNFNTSNVTNMGYMFSDASNLTTIKYGPSFVYKNGAFVSQMFLRCPANKPTDPSWEGVL